MSIDLPHRTLRHESTLPLGIKPHWVTRGFVAVVLLAALETGTAWVDRPIIAGLLLLSGALAVGVAVWIRVWASLYIAGRKTRELVTAGPYAFVRNPLYLCSLLGAFGAAMGTETMTLPLLVLLAFMLYYPHVIAREERKLLALHGVAFEQYRARAGRLWPQRGAASLEPEPETWLVRTRDFRRQALDAVWSIWAFGLFAAIATLHAQGLLPAWVRLY